VPSREGITTATYLLTYLASEAAGNIPLMMTSRLSIAVDITRSVTFRISIFQNEPIRATLSVDQLASPNRTDRGYWCQGAIACSDLSLSLFLSLFVVVCLSEDQSQHWFVPTNTSVGPIRDLATPDWTGARLQIYSRSSLVLCTTNGP